MPSRARAALLDVGCAVAVAATLIGLLLVTGGIWENVAGSDLHGAFVPRYEAVARAVVYERRLPLWNPWELCGTPLHGTAQGGALYPPVLLAFATLPSWAAVQALYGFHAFVLAWGALLYLRRHAVGRGPAMLAAFIAFAGVFTGHAHVGFDHPNFLGSVAWVPLLLLAWERAVTSGVRPWLGVFALVSATQWCVSYPDFPMDMPVLLGLVALVTPAGTVWRRLLVLASGLALGAALAAAQIAPLAEAVAGSVRGGTSFDDLRQILNAPLADLVPAMQARIGVAALVLALAGVLGGGRAALGWLLAVLWASFALDPPLVWLYEIPPYAGSRFPFGWGHLAPLFLGFLAAAGVSAGLRARSRTVMAAVVALALVAGATTAGVAVRIPRELSRRAPQLADAPAYDVLAERAARIEEALGLGGPRFVSGIDVRTGAPLRHRLHAAAGYDPTMPPRRIARLLDEAGIGTVGRPRWPIMHQRAHLLDRLGVGTLVVPPGFGGPALRRGFERVSTLPGGEVVLAKPALPRARVVHAVVRAASENDAFRLVTDARVQPGAVAVVEGDADPPVEPAAPGSTERVRIARDEPERVEIDVDLATAGLLVLTDTFAPGWRADVDGEPAEVLLADYAFRAVPVPPGTHRVTLRYRPTSVVIGGLVTLAAGLVVLLLLASGRATSFRTAGRRSESRS